MEKASKEKTLISRKNFLRVCGSVIAGGALAGVTGTLAKRTGKSDAQQEIGNDLRVADSSSPVSPYRKIVSFDTPGVVEGFDLHDGKLYVAASDFISVFSPEGEAMHRFPVGETTRDIAVSSSEIYVLYTNKVKVFSFEGTLLREWSSCSDLSGYCSMALAGDHVFVTDVVNKNICKYTSGGTFVKFISSPNGFIIPSYTFAIEHADNVLYCSNSGRHQVERYTLDGEYLGAFGKTGGAPGMFTGCCNPTYLSCTANGEIITSEKGFPRISCYGNKGDFHALLLDAAMLGGGHSAYDVKVQGDKIFVAGKSRISIFRYDPALAAASSCARCNKNCPLKI
ncbi:MAG: hypothetical protein LBS63_03700 [Prevotellaceae bacterium]|jgi:hypothetical protein|nr:hypothetical protein [Prevotellaceae bacterium]